MESHLVTELRWAGYQFCVLNCKKCLPVADALHPAAWPAVGRDG